MAKPKQDAKEAREDKEPDAEPKRDAKKPREDKLPDAEEPREDKYVQADADKKTQAPLPAGKGQVAAMVRAMKKKHRLQ